MDLLNEVEITAAEEEPLKMDLEVDEQTESSEAQIQSKEVVTEKSIEE